MADYCKDCVNMFFGYKYRWYHYRYFWTKDVCEYCGKETHLVASFTILGYIADRRNEYKEIQERLKRGNDDDEL